MLSAEQQEARKGRITSSRIAAVVGLDARKSRLQLALELRGDLPREEPANMKAIDRGNALESLILQHPCDVHPGIVARAAEFRVHPDHPELADSADAVYVTGDEGDATGPAVAIGEGKSAGMGVAADYGEEGTDDVADYTLTQAHWHLAHWLEVDLCYVPVLVGGYAFEFRCYEVDRDDEFESHLVEEALRFHRDHVVGDTLPDPDYRDTSTIAKMYPNERVAMEEATPDAVRLLLEKERWKQRKTLCERHELQAKAELALVMGEASKMVSKDGSINFKRRQTTNWWKAAQETMAAEDPAAVERAIEDSKTVDWQKVARALGVTDKMAKAFKEDGTGERSLVAYPKKIHKDRLAVEAAEWLKRATT